MIKKTIGKIWKQVSWIVKRNGKHVFFIIPSLNIECQKQPAHLSINKIKRCIKKIRNKIQLNLVVCLKKTKGNHLENKNRFYSARLIYDLHRNKNENIIFFFLIKKSRLNFLIIPDKKNTFQIKRAE
jgi:hypothetical protein